MRVKIKPEIATMVFETVNSGDYQRIQLPTGRCWFIPKDLFDIVPEPWKVGDKALDLDRDECEIVVILRDLAGVDYGENSITKPMFWALSELSRPTGATP